MSWLRASASQRGSIPLVLLSIIVLGGVTAALFLTVRYGQVSSARDRDVNQAIQVADAGVQEAFVRIAAGEFDGVSIGQRFPAGGDPQPEGSTGRGNYAWQAMRTGHDAWSVRSSGQVGDAELVVEARMSAQNQFDFGLWGDRILNVQTGGTTITSGDGEQVLVGSNGEVTLQNQLLNQIVAGNIRLECYTPSASGACDEYGIVNVDQRVEHLDLAAEAYAPGGDCDVPAMASEEEGVFTYTTDDERSVEYHEEPYEGDFALVRGTTYCFPSVTFPAANHGRYHWLDDTGQAAPNPADESNRVIINVPPDSFDDSRTDAGLTVGGSGNNTAWVNWWPEDADIGDLQTRASDLIIQIGEGRDVRFPNNHMSIAAAIYAPGSVCQRPPQGDFFGSIICGEIAAPGTGPGGGGGGWTFVYDPSLIDVMIEGRFSIVYWNQESVSSSGLGFLD